MVKSPTSHFGALHVLALALGLLAIAPTAPTAAIAAGAKSLPPTHLAPTHSPRLNPRMAVGRSHGGGAPTDRQFRRNDPSATSSRAITDDYRYSWAVGYQNYPARKHVTGVWVLQQNAKPHIDDTNEASASLAHSVGQLWAIGRRGSSCMSDVETGWMVSKGQYGDLQPHLFIYAWDCGVGLGYVGQSSIPWVQYSSVIAPNSVISHDHALHIYGVDLYDGNWWFYYDGQWVGYIPSSAWTRFFPSTIKEGEAGGEVSTPEYETCTTMGNEGRYGTYRHAALVDNVWYEHEGIKTAAMLNSYNNDTKYTTGSWSQGQPGPQFRYGGPGWCGG